MTPKISLIAIAGLAALAMTASAAFAQSEPTKRGLGDFGKTYVQSDTIMSPDAVDRAAAAKRANMLNARERGLGVSVGNGKVSALEARERSLGAKNETQLSSDFYADGFAQAVKPHEPSSGPVRDDRFRIDPTTVPSPVTATSSGRDIEWPTIGIGFGIGIALLLGLGLVMKATHTRPFAH